MKCRQIQILLPDFIQGKSTTEEHNLVSGHLALCELCNEETTQLHKLITNIQMLNHPEPSRSYFGTLLPRIHSRIEKKSMPFIPEWALRFVFPMAAALVIVIVLSQVDLLNGSDQESTLNMLFGELSSEELQQVTDQTTLHSEIDASSTSDGAFDEIDNDVETLQVLLTSEDRTILIAGLDADEALSILNEQEEERILSVLQQQPIFN